MCSFVSEWSTAAIEHTISTEEARRDLSLSLRAQVKAMGEGTDESVSASLVRTIQNLPHIEKPLYIDAMNAAPTWSDMESLGSNKYINDECIRAMLGSKMTHIPGPHSFVVVDPSVFNQETRQFIFHNSAWNNRAAFRCSTPCWRTAPESGCDQYPSNKRSAHWVVKPLESLRQDHSNSQNHAWIDVLRRQRVLKFWDSCLFFFGYVSSPFFIDDET